MATPDTWTYDDSRQRVKEATPAWLASNRAFAEGDHLQAGHLTASGLAAMSGVGGLAGWIAPLLPAAHPLYANQINGIIRGFVSSNKIGEVIGRHKAGVVGRQPVRGFESRAPIPKGKEMTAELMRLKETADAWMASRWEVEGMHGSLQQAIANLLYSGRQPARLMIPRGYLSDGQNGAKVVPRLPLEQMVGLIRLTYPKPEESTVYVDPDTFEQVGIFLYEQDQKRCAELTWVDQSSKLTHIRQVTDEGEVEITYDFGGMMPIFEMTRAPLVTPQIVQNQKALNLALSTVPANVHSAGSRARALFNVDPPGKEVMEGDEKVFKPDPVDWGSGVIHYFQGAPIYDETTGKITGYATPSMQTEEPIDVKPSAEAVELHAREILSEARQLHALMGADATASAISRIVARVEFMGSLMETKPSADGCMEWQMDTRLAMAEAFFGGREGGRSPHPYTTYLRANVECKLDPGPITPEERTALDQLVENGRISEETALALMGVEDVQEERARVANERKAERVFALIERADNVGMDRVAVLTILGGLPPEEAQALARGDVTGGVTQ